MPDNVGPYTSVAKLLTELANAGKATKLDLILTNKNNVGPGTLTTYDFAPATPAPAIGQYLVQGNYHSFITNVAGNVVTVSDGTNIANGQARAIASTFQESELQDFIVEAMAFIDRHTRQWFNARTFDDTNPILIEGNNSEVLFLPVPIISISSLRKQPDSQVLDPTFYQVFNSRAFPDDRKNPMIKLRQEDDDVLFVSSGKFMRGVRARLTGVFGFLEPDGSTPKMIQRATLKLALIYASKTLGEQAAESAEGGDVGPIKRERTDLHEIEYFDPRTSASKAALNEGSGLSGDDYVDDVIAAYKGPILVTGTFPDIGVEAPVIWSWTKDQTGRDS